MRSSVEKVYLERGPAVCLDEQVLQTPAVLAQLCPPHPAQAGHKPTPWIQEINATVSFLYRTMEPVEVMLVS